MDGAAKIAARRKIFRFTTSARAAGWEMMRKRISSPCARIVTERDMVITKNDKANRKPGR